MLHREDTLREDTRWPGRILRQHRSELLGGHIMEVG